MPLTAEVIDVDKGWDRILKTMRGPLRKRPHARVGIISTRQNRVTTRGQGASLKSTTLATIAAQNEYGTSRIPSRPFMRTAFDSHVDDYQRMMAVGFGQILDGRPVEAVLTEVGNEARTHMVEQIDSSPSWAEPNADMTIRMKGSSHPLIDTGTLRASIAFDVSQTNEGAGGGASLPAGGGDE